MAAHARGDFAEAVDILRPVRYQWAPVGGSAAQVSRIGGGGKVVCGLYNVEVNRKWIMARELSFSKFILDATCNY